MSNVVQKVSSYAAYLFNFIIRLFGIDITISVDTFCCNSKDKQENYKPLQLN